MERKSAILGRSNPISLSSQNYLATGFKHQLKMAAIKIIWQIYTVLPAAAAGELCRSVFNTADPDVLAFRLQLINISRIVNDNQMRMRLG